MSKTDILSWGGVVLGAMGDNPIAALALLVAVLALLLAHRVVSKDRKE